MSFESTSDLRPASSPRQPRPNTLRWGLAVDEKRYGAHRLDWENLRACGLIADALPIVSNPRRALSPASNLKDVGKVPSRLDGSGHVIGFQGWTAYRATDDDIRNWAAIPDYGFGIQTRDVRAIDVDVEDPISAARVKSVLAQWGQFPLRTRSDSARFLAAVRVPGKLPKRKLDIGHGIIEFLGDGNQFVAAGTHKAGVRYQWNTWDGFFPEEIPTLQPSNFDALWSALCSAFEANASIGALPNDRLAARESAANRDPTARRLVDRGMLRARRPDGGLNIECPWSDEHSTHSGASETTYWPPYTGGHEHGGFKCMHAHCEARSVSDLRQKIGVSVEDTGRDEFVVLRASEFADRPLPTWWIKGVLPAEGLALVVGQPGSGKSFVVLDIAAAIAQGKPWNGRKSKRGRVVIVAAEGAAGFSKRLRAYGRGDFMAPEAGWDDGLGILDGSPHLLRPEHVDAVVAAAEISGGADVVVIDTLAAVTPGVDENSSEGMGAAIDAAKRLGERLAALVILVHHLGKDAARGARGWSGITGAADMILVVDRAPVGRTLVVQKSKDGEDGSTFGFSLRQVQIGVDEDGDPATSCAVDWSQTAPGVAPVAPQRQRRRGPYEAAILATCGARLTSGAVTDDESLIAGSLSLVPKPAGRDRRRESLARAIAKLRVAGLLPQKDARD